MKCSQKKTKPKFRIAYLHTQKVIFRGEHKKYVDFIRKDIIKKITILWWFKQTKNCRNLKSSWVRRPSYSKIQIFLDVIFVKNLILSKPYNNANIMKTQIFKKLSMTLKVI